MDNVVRSGVYAASALERRQRGQVVVSHHDERILRVPPLHLRVVPNSRTDTVDSDEAEPRKTLDPPALPLFVDVMLAHLLWNRRGEQDDGRETCQRFEKRRGARFGQMLCDFE